MGSSYSDYTIHRLEGAGDGGEDDHPVRGNSDLMQSWLQIDRVDGAEKLIR